MFSEEYFIAFFTNIIRYYDMTIKSSTFFIFFFFQKINKLLMSVSIILYSMYLTKVHNNQTV